MSTPGRLALLVLTIICSCPLGARGQDARPGVVVAVVDPDGLPVPGAVVGLRNGQSRSAFRTGASGQVTIRTDLPADIEVRAPGFETAVRQIDSEAPTPVVVQLALPVLRTSVDVVVRDEPVRGAGVGSALAVNQSGARTVFDAIDALLPGVSVTRRGVMGYGIATNGTGGVSVHGVGGQPNTQILVVVDGRPDVQSLMGHPLPDAYGLSDAQRVKVTQGPASVLYGSNAMGGVIDIGTERPAAGTHLRASTSFGSYGSGQHRLTFGSSGSGGYYLASASLDHTDGDRPSSAYRGETARLAGGAALSSRWSLDLQGRFTDFRVEDPGPVGKPVGSTASVHRGGVSATLDNAGSRTWGYARVFGSFGRHEITDGFRSTDDAVGVRAQQYVTLGNRTVVDLGFDAARAGGEASNVITSLDYGRHHGTTVAGFARAQHALQRFNLHGGLRYDYDTLVDGRGLLVPEAGVAFAVNDRVNLSVDAGRGFRNPTIRELYLFPAPNPTLQPESLWNYQASVEVRPTRRLTTAATVYYADISNLVVTQGRYPNLQLRNAGRAINRGVDATLRWRASSLLSFTAGYGHLDSTNLPPSVPADKLTYAVDFSPARFSVRIGGQSVGDRWADAAHSATLDGYTALTVQATVPLGRKVSVIATIDNVLDQNYQVVSGYPMPGRNGMIGMTFGF